MSDGLLSLSPPGQKKKIQTYDRDSFVIQTPPDISEDIISNLFMATDLFLFGS